MFKAIIILTAISFLAVASGDVSAAGTEFLNVEAGQRLSGVVEFQISNESGAETAEVLFIAPSRCCGWATSADCPSAEGPCTVSFDMRWLPRSGRYTVEPVVWTRGEFVLFGEEISVQVRK